MVEILFYIFAATLILASLMVISLRNPVHSVLFLIFAFFNAAALFVMLGAEFIAMTLIIVYVGAVAVLFLFVVMMLNVNVAALKVGFLKHMPWGVLVGSLIFFQLMVALSYSSSFFPQNLEPVVEEMTNTARIGMVLYTDYFIAFQVSGLILLVAMIGAIVLTLTHGKDARRQSIKTQVMRTKADSIEMVDVNFREGVKL